MGNKQNKQASLPEEVSKTTFELAWPDYFAMNNNKKLNQ